MILPVYPFTKSRNPENSKFQFRIFLSFGIWIFFLPCGADFVVVPDVRIQTEVYVYAYSQAMCLQSQYVGIHIIINACKNVCGVLCLKLCNYFMQIFFASNVLASLRLLYSIFHTQYYK